MFKQVAVVLLLALCCGTAIRASDSADPQSVKVTITGVLHEDKNGFFFKIDNAIYDIAMNVENKDDMHKFYSGLNGDLVKITGELHVEQGENNSQMSLVVYTNDISRLKGQRVVRERVVEERPIIREHYVEHHNHIDLPFVHIGW